MASIADPGPAMMRTADMLRAFLPHRGDAIVVPGRGGRYWTQLSDKPGLDVPLGDPAMGGHAGFALGLTLARPERRVVLFDSEGDILMSLGILATIAEQRPANFYHFLIDNGCYATTGGQPVPNADRIAYDAIARGAGYPHTYAFADLEPFVRALPAILERPGPVFVALKLVPEIENEPIGRRRRWQTRSREEVLADLHAALGISG
jgi:thiamine pyrophosphate-dependent acetolactate synthase large subunit-like protein